MTDTVKGFTVTLEKDVRIDDIETTMQAIRMIKGIADVQPSVTNSDDLMNRMMIMVDIKKQFYQFIQRL